MGAGHQDGAAASAAPPVAEAADGGGREENLAINTLSVPYEQRTNSPRAATKENLQEDRVKSAATSDGAKADAPSPSPYHVVAGTRSREDTLLFFVKDNHGPINPLNDIPLFADESRNILNFIVEIPRETNAKLELDTGQPLSPIKQDEKKGRKRFVHNVFPYNGYIWNYGCLPQTWENPNEVHMETGALGDGDPLDVCEIGSMLSYIGEVKQVKVLGVLGMIDDDEMDWKVIAVDVRDPLAAEVSDVEDLKRKVPGLLHATFSWFRTYKVPDGKGFNLFAFRDTVQSAEYAFDIIRECHHAWKMTASGHVKHPKVNATNTTLRRSRFRIGVDEAKEMVERSLRESEPAPGESAEDSKCGDPSSQKVGKPLAPMPVGSSSSDLYRLGGGAAGSGGGGGNNADAESTSSVGRPMMSVKRFCMEMQRMFPHGSNDLSLLLTELGVAFKCIRSLLLDSPNVELSILKDTANAQMHASMAASGLCCLIYSVEHHAAMPLYDDVDVGNYIVVYTSLSGYPGGTMGTTFSVYARKTSQGEHGDSSDLLSRTGYEQVAAGYCIYAAYTAFVLSMGYGTHMFMLDSISGHFVIAGQHMKIPQRGRVYSFNTAKLPQLSAGVRRYVRECDHENSGKYFRYEDNIVANFHRVLLEGGIMFLPGPSGADLANYLGFAAPLGYLAHQAGGKASVGKRDVLELNSWNLDMVVPLFIGSRTDVDRVEQLLIGQATEQRNVVDPSKHLRVH